MMRRGDGAFGILMGAAVGALFLLPAYGAAQAASSVLCTDVASSSPLEDLTRCAEQEDAAAQFNLGWMYGAFLDVRRPNAHEKRGGLVPEDDEEAVRWFQLAADQGHANAQFMLGIMYTRGHGVQTDLVLAHMWYLLSASHCAISFSCDMESRTVAGSNKNFIERRMTREQIAEAHRLSLEWILAHPGDGGS